MRPIPIQCNLMPSSLAEAKATGLTYSEYSVSEKGDELRRLKAVEQGGLCGYCECKLTDEGGVLPKKVAHIDHFYQQSRYPKKIFDWENMVLSCEDANTCGRYKDRQKKYAAIDIINPHVENPRKYITFVQSSKFRMRAVAVSTLNPEERERAEHTIDALQLNDQRLLTQRSIAWVASKQVVDCFVDEPQTEEWYELVYLMLQDMENREFPSTLQANAKAILGLS